MTKSITLSYSTSYCWNGDVEISKSSTDVTFEWRLEASRLSSRCCGSLSRTHIWQKPTHGNVRMALWWQKKNKATLLTGCVTHHCLALSCCLLVWVLVTNLGNFNLCLPLFSEIPTLGVILLGLEPRQFDFRGVNRKIPFQEVPSWHFVWLNRCWAAFGLIPFPWLEICFRARHFLAISVTVNALFDGVCVWGVENMNVWQARLPMTLFSLRDSNSQCDISCLSLWEPKMHFHTRVRHLKGSQANTILSVGLHHRRDLLSAT